jgi:polyphenol oxidase
MMSVPDVCFRVEGNVTIAWTSANSGDFALNAPDVASLRKAVAGGIPVTWTSQVHGNGVVYAQLDDIERMEQDPSEVACADAIVVDSPGTRSGPLAASVITADCAPVAFWTSDGVVGVAHAGWRGLLSGVVEATATAVKQRSSMPETISAVIGPCIGPCCYAFQAADLDPIADRYGSDVRSTTKTGATSLDIRVGICSALHAAAVRFAGHLSDSERPHCTSCETRWFSWRRDHQLLRQALIVWAS